MSEPTITTSTATQRPEWGPAHWRDEIDLDFDFAPDDN